MERIKRSSTTVSCLRGRDRPNNVLLVVYCGHCSLVITPTARITPNFHNGAY